MDKQRRSDLEEGEQEDDDDDENRNKRKLVSKTDLTNTLKLSKNDNDI